jgi:carboxyl-terminal processing protease
MVVVIDGAAASGALTVAGALQDNGRAAPAGSGSFAKGSEQSVVPVPWLVSTELAGALTRRPCSA